MINVTKSYLPPFEEYSKYLEKIWGNSWLTNQGPLVQELEHKLIDYLGVENLLFVSNGTIAIQLALKALELKGEIITTPFSYVATTTAVLWENCTPVFADIEKRSLCIDPEKIEELITSLLYNSTPPIGLIYAVAFLDLQISNTFFSAFRL